MARTARNEEPHGAAGRPLLVSPNEAASMLAIGRSTMYELMASGQLPSVKIGAARRLLVADIEAYVARLPRVLPGPQHPPKRPEQRSDQRRSA